MALRLVFGIQLDAPPRIVVVRFGLRRADALLLVRVDEMRQLARRIFLVIHTEILEQALDRRQLIGRIEDRKSRRQRRLAVMHAQHAVAQTVESADPHAARRAEMQRQHRRQPRQHLLRRLVGKGDGQHGMRARLPR